MPDEADSLPNLVRQYRSGYKGSQQQLVNALNFRSRAASLNLHIVQVAAAEEIMRLSRLVETLGAACITVNDYAKDEGDRVYLGSTNDLDEVREAVAAFDAYHLDGEPPCES